MLPRKLVVFSAIAFLISACSKNTIESDVSQEIKEPKSSQQIVYFDQGWSRDEAYSFYNTSQGSHLIPYAWFLALEQHNNETLFNDPQNIQKFGYIPQTSTNEGKEYVLPIGFVKDDISDPVLSASLVESRLANNVDDNNNGNNVWLGLTCSACHTSEIQYNNKTFRIDGGAALADMQTMLKDMYAALIATSNDDEKLTRFAKNVLNEGGYNETEKAFIKSQLDHYTIWLSDYINVNYKGTTAPYGYGRLDAFGAILNRVTSTLLENPNNGAPANAPVSFPYLWNTAQLDWVQWNGSVNNHIGRNIGEATGVFARTILTTDNEEDRFYSSANLRNLDQLEHLMGKLDSPKWTQEGASLPPINDEKAEKGKVLFAKNCVACHGVKDENGQYPMTAPNDFGKQSIVITMTPLKDVRTDPLMAMNFVSPQFDVEPGQMRKYVIEDAVAMATKIGIAKGLSGQALIQMQEATVQKYRNMPKVPRALVLSAASSRIIKRKFAENDLLDKPDIMLAISGYRNEEKNPADLVAYKGRPLNGIWATAPYMHNGSMSTLYQTLLPDAERETSFYVGGNTFDPVNVGFIATGQGNSFLFETTDESGNPIMGNTNTGHSGNMYTKTLDDDGQWHDFTDEQRYQLIEYMKTL